MQNGSNNTIASQFYETRLGSFDEMLNNETVQPHWQKFMEELNAMGGTELENRRKENQRLLRENGVTYTIYEGDGKSSASWKLDPIPLLISESEWLTIEQGLVQRAELLNLIFKDLYGKQRLLKNGILPAELIFAHQNYSFPCIGSVHENSHLTLYAANLARGSNGQMWVLNDHTQAPSGMGYTLENRNVIGTVMADLIQKSPVTRLTPFFNSLQNHLAGIAPHHKDDPHIVILTPGSLNETYFEHAYLASQLGFTLVQGEDLTVRDGKVWLQTLEGLQQVDVILRRVDDDYCDPLELRNDSRLGVAGLLQAYRLGHIGIANPLGSGILQNPGLLAFLPSLCQYFLNQELKLPSVASWWCGQKKECDFVIKHLDKMAIKPLYKTPGNQVVFGHQLSKEQQQELIKRIQHQPHLYVGQEQITFSTTPSLINGHIEARNSILRTFAVSNGESYTVMPGGLTRVAQEKEQFAVSNQFGAVNKDTWILRNTKHSNEKSTPIYKDKTPLHPVSEPLTSRAADNLFWTGRHFERIQNAARLMRIILHKQNNLLIGQDTVKQQCLNNLLCALTHLTSTYPGFISNQPLSDLEQKKEILDLLQDKGRYGSIAHSIDSFFHSAYNVRDLWSQDTWHCIDSIQHFWHNQVANMNHPHPRMSHYLSELSTRMAAFSGFTAESMSREFGWLLLQIGRTLEHALATISILRSTMVNMQPHAHMSQLMESILLATDSFSLYQRRYRSVPKIKLVLDLLLKDPNHPHSLLFQLHYLNQSITKLPNRLIKNQLSKEQALIIRAYTELQLSELTNLLEQQDENNVFHKLDQLFADTSELLWELSQNITLSYFNHINPIHQLTGKNPVKP